MSLEMAHKVIVPPKKIISRSFLNSGTLIVNIYHTFPDIVLYGESIIYLLLTPDVLSMSGSQTKNLFVLVALFCLCVGLIYGSWRQHYFECTE